MLIKWVPDNEFTQFHYSDTLSQWDGAADIVSNIKYQTGVAAIPFPTPSTDFGTGAYHIDGFTWSDSDGTYSVPEINIPVGAIIVAQYTGSSTGFSLQLTTLEWVHANGRVLAIY